MTEAAGLLQTGGAFRRRVGLAQSGGGLVMIGERPDGLSIYEDDSAFDHFDREGRWRRCYRHGRHFLKEVSGRVCEVGRRAGAVELDDASVLATTAEGLDEAIRERALRLLRNPGDRIEPPASAGSLDPDRLHWHLAAVAGWDTARWQGARTLFERVYGKTILPSPELGPVLPVLPIVGQGFVAHLAGVLALWGSRARGCRSVLMLGREALLASAATWRSWSEAVTSWRASGHELRAVWQGGDEPDWAGLRAAGLARVHLAPELDQEARDRTIEHLKAAGLPWLSAAGRSEVGAPRGEVAMIRDQPGIA